MTNITSETCVQMKDFPFAIEHPCQKKCNVLKRFGKWLVEISSKMRFTRKISSTTTSDEQEQDEHEIMQTQTHHTFCDTLCQLLSLNLLKEWALNIQTQLDDAQVMPEKMPGTAMLVNNTQEDEGYAMLLSNLATGHVADEFRWI